MKIKVIEQPTKIYFCEIYRITITIDGCKYSLVINDNDNGCEYEVEPQPTSEEVRMALDQFVHYSYVVGSDNSWKEAKEGDELEIYYEL